MDFKRSYPRLATFLSKYSISNKKDQQQSFWHWFTLSLFGLLTIANFPQQLFLLFVFTLIVALIKGPVMILWGMIYTFFISLFPPIGILLSVLFFLVNIGTLTKNWRLSLVAGFFYFYHFAILLLKSFGDLNNDYFVTVSLLVGLILFHLMLKKLYTGYEIGRTVFWYIFAIPFTVVTALLPSRLKRKRFPKIK